MVDRSVRDRFDLVFGRLASLFAANPIYIYPRETKTKEEEQEGEKRESVSISSVFFL